MIFVDTGAWFAYFVDSDPDHASAESLLECAVEPFVTTDYVVDELLTLLRARREAHRALVVGRTLIQQALCRIEWVTPGDFETAWIVFQQFQDKGWSFTDCVSQVVIQRLAIETAISFDDHFRQFGIVRVLP